MTNRKDWNPAQIAMIQDRIHIMRQNMLEHAVTVTKEIGFSEQFERDFAILMILIGAAQLAALSSPRLYQAFKVQCMVMARSDRRAVVQSSLMEMGPEIFGGEQ